MKKELLISLADIFNLKILDSSNLVSNELKGTCRKVFCSIDNHLNNIIVSNNGSNVFIESKNRILLSSLASVSKTIEDKIGADILVYDHKEISLLDKQFTIKALLQKETDGWIVSNVYLKEKNAKNYYPLDSVLNEVDANKIKKSASNNSIIAATIYQSLVDESLIGNGLEVDLITTNDLEAIPIDVNTDFYTPFINDLQNGNNIISASISSYGLNKTAQELNISIEQNDYSHDLNIERELAHEHIWYQQNGQVAIEHNGELVKTPIAEAISSFKTKLLLFDVNKFSDHKKSYYCFKRLKHCYCLLRELVEIVKLRRFAQAKDYGFDGAYANLDLPMGERVWDYAREEDELKGKELEIKEQIRYKPTYDAYGFYYVQNNTEGAPLTWDRIEKGENFCPSSRSARL